MRIYPHPAMETMNIGVTEQQLIRRALEEAKGNKSKAARLLGLTRAQLYTRLEKQGRRQSPRREPPE